MGIREAIENATWPLRKAVWKVEENVIWPLADAVRSTRRPDGSRVRRKWIHRPHRLRVGRSEASLPFETADPSEVTSASEVAVGPDGTTRSEVASAPERIGVSDVGAPGRLSVFSRLDVRLALATVAFAASVGVGVAAIAGGFGGKDRAASTLPTVATPPKAPASSGTHPTQTTLQGVTPNFKTSPNAASKADAATAASVTPLHGTNAKPSRIPAGSEDEAAALETARDFAGAFVLYELGQSNAKVKKTFARTATPALVKSLRDRPPRLPDSGKVPKARVQNVVLGVRHGRQVAASVSLLRLGDLSELRLTLTRRHQTWAVSEVLG